MKINDVLMMTSIIIMVVGFCVYLYFLFFSKLFFNKQDKTSAEKASTFGEFINGVTGPLFALAGFMIIYSTIMDQKEITKTQQFENYFFKFLDYHRTNNERITIKGAKSCNPVSGRQVWVNFRGIIKKAYHIIQSDSAYTRMTYHQKIDLSFAILNYGLGSSDTSRLYKYLDQYQLSIQDKNSLFKKLRAVEHCDQVSVYFYGFSNVLENYFHEYFTYMNYVDACTFIDNNEKIKYVEILNAQNDIYCNAVIYFYLQSNISTEAQKKLAKTYQLLEKMDTSLISFTDEP